MRFLCFELRTVMRSWRVVLGFRFLRDMVSSTSDLHSELNVLDNLNPR